MVCSSLQAHTHKRMDVELVQIFRLIEPGSCSVPCVLLSWELQGCILHYVYCASELRNLCVMSTPLFFRLQAIFSLSKQVTECCFSTLQLSAVTEHVCFTLLCYRDAVGRLFAHLSRLHVHQRPLPGAARTISSLTLHACRNQFRFQAAYVSVLIL